MRRRHISIPDEARRSFLKWTLGLGATLGVRPWQVFEVNESIIGAAFAQEAACMPVNRFVGSVMGNGGFAWMSLLFPFTNQATQGGNSAYHATGQSIAQAVEAGDHPMLLGPQAPRFRNSKITGFVCGANETHTNTPVTALSVDTGVSLFAAATALQTATPTLVPAIAIGQLPFGTANGAAQLASVPSPSGLVDLFNSASSTAGGALANAQNAAVFEAYYKANLGLRRAANLPTTRRGFRVGKVASNLLGKNLSDQLRPTAADLARYGIDANTPAKLSSIAATLITTVKAFRLNLTNSVLLPGMNDDPHDAFTNGNTLLATVTTLGKLWQAFMDDLMNEPDPMCSGMKIGDNTVIAWTGDTGKDPNQRNAWPDGTPGNSNWMYVSGANQLRSGWFGELRGNGSIETWNPETGANMPGGNPAQLSGPAGAAVLYAIAKGDMQRVNDFYRGRSIAGVVKPKLM